MANLGKLQATVTADVSGFKQNLKQAEASAEGFKQKVSKSFDGINASIGGLASKLSVFGVALAPAVISAWVKSTLDAADALGKMADRTGVSVERLDGLKYAVELSGGEVADLEKGLLSLNKRLSDAGSGDAKTNALFTSLGINANSAEEALLQLADAFPRLSSADQARAASDLLGGSYKQLLPLLVGGRQAIEDLIAEKQRLNPVTEETARKAAELNDNLDRIKTLSNSVAAEIGVSLLPALNSITQEFLDGIRAAGGFWSALSTFGLSNPFKTPQEQVDSYTKDIQELEKRIERLNSIDPSMGGNEAWEAAKLKDKRKELEEERKKWQNLVDFQYKNNPVGPPEPKRDVSSIKLPTEGDNKPSKPKGTTQKRPDIGNLDNLIRDIDEREYLKEVAEAKRKVQEEQAKLNALISGTPSEKLKEVESNLVFLQKAYEEGRISAEVFNQAAVLQANGLGEISDQAAQKLIGFQDIANQAAKNLAQSFMDFATSADQSFSDFSKNFLKQIAQMISQAILLNTITQIGNGMAGSSNGFISAIGKALIPSANGNVFTPGAGGPNLVPFANGGVFSSPVTFPIAGGRTGLMGEAGPEAIMPLTRKNGRLGVDASGMGVVNNYNISVQVESNSSNPDAVGNAVAEKVIRAIAKQEIANSRRVGGQLNPI